MWDVPMSLIGSCAMPRSSRCAAAASNSSLVLNPEGQVVEADAVLVETVVGHRPQADQRVAGAVDDAAEQEPQLLPRLGVRVVWHLQQNRPAEDAS